MKMVSDLSRVRAQRTNNYHQFVFGALGAPYKTYIPTTYNPLLPTSV